jgi:micrococcal nuclease
MHEGRYMGRMNTMLASKSLMLCSVLLLALSCVLHAQEYHKCARVVDGDTIVVLLDGKKEKVRLIGVDTPETVHPNKPVEHYGREATAFTKTMVEGKLVRLEYDSQQRDRYGRLLAYVYLEDGTFLNKEIIRQGYGFAYTRFPFTFMEEFRACEKQAREKKVGLWGEK